MQTLFTKCSYTQSTSNKMVLFFWEILKRRKKMIFFCIFVRTKTIKIKVHSFEMMDKKQSFRLKIERLHILFSYLYRYYIE